MTALRQSPRTISIWARAVSRAGFSCDVVAFVVEVPEVVPLVFSGMGFLSGCSRLAEGLLPASWPGRMRERVALSGRLPAWVTIKAAHQVGAILKYLDADSLIQASYAFYM